MCNLLHFCWNAPNHFVLTAESECKNRMHHCVHAASTPRMLDVVLTSLKTKQKYHATITTARLREGTDWGNWDDQRQGMDSI